MDYAVLKQVHVACAGLSYLGFLLRGVAMIRNAPLLRNRWIRIAAHTNDTVLLVTAIAMVVMSGQYPLAHPWLAAKVAALVAYIALGMVALHYGRDLRTRIAAWLAAQAVFLYIVIVALTRHPLVLW